MNKFNSKIIGLTALLLIFSLWSCNDDLQSAPESAAPDDVPASIYADFTLSYPDATDAVWSVTDEYAVVSFSSTVSRAESARRSTVWYRLADRLKKMHATTIPFTELPADVAEAFRSGEYGSLTPSDHANVITRYVSGNVEHIYVIQAKGALEGTVATTVKLYYTEEGILVKLSSEIVYDESFADPDNHGDFDEWLPKTPADFIRAYVDTYYPGARYLYICENQNLTKVKILDGHTARLLLFDADGSWLSTATEIDDDDIPADILAIFRTSEYAGWHIHQITEYITAADGHYFLLSLENGKNKAELRIEADGTVSGDPSTPSDPEKPVNPSDEDQYLTKAEIEGFITAKYPGASIIKYDYDDDKAEIEITYNGHKIKVEFEHHAQGYTWRQSEWDFNVRDTASLPALIVNTIADRYSEYRLEYLSYIETASDAPCYEAGLKSSRTKKMIKVKMDQQGNVIAEYGVR